jgi:hypothetical protein
MKNDYLSLSQKECIEFFEKSLPEFLSNDMLRNKFVIIFNKELKGAYDTFEAAFEKALNKYPLSEFVIQQVIDNNDVVTFLKSAV